jgi:hypothetical protein
MLMALGAEVVGGGDAGVHPVDGDLACNPPHEEIMPPVRPVRGGPIRVLDNQ